MKWLSRIAAGIGHVFVTYNRRVVPMMAAGVAFYFLLGLIPFLFLTTAVAGLVFRRNPAAFDSLSTNLINLLFRGNLTDCNSGFRCIRKSAYESWDIRSDGMEFASELLIKALKAKATTVEISSGLRRGPDDREAHLRTWRDGMRHLLFILSERPQLFEWIGLIVLGASSALQLFALVTGPIQILGLNIFDFHSQALLLLAALTGTQLYLFSCVLYLRGHEKSTRLTRKLISLDEGVLFFLLLGLLAAVAAVVLYIVLAWISADFGGLRLINILLILVHFLSVPGMLAIALLGIHVFKKGERGG